MTPKSLSALFCVALVAGCGGGGGGLLSTGSNSTVAPPSSGTSNASAVPFTTVSAIPDTGAVRVQGQAVTAPVTTGTFGDLTLGTPDGMTTSQAEITQQNGDVTGMRFVAGSNGVAFDSTQGDLITTANGEIYATSTDSRREAVLADAAGVGFEHQSFGIWANRNTAGNGNAGAGSYGAQTPTSGLPSAGTVANYAGAAIGIATERTNSFTTLSSVAVATNFTTAVITSSNTRNRETGIPERDLDFAGSGPVSGSGFTASIVTNGAANGTANGQFYGPNAQEVGGTFSATGSNVNYIGSFGARRP